VSSDRGAAGETRSAWSRAEAAISLFIALGFAFGSQATTVLAAAAAPDDPALFPATPTSEQNATASGWRVGAFIDGAYLNDFTSPANHRFRNRGTTPRVDEFDINMAAAYLRKAISKTSRWGVEVTTQAGQDSKTFGFSPTAPNLAGADWLLHLGPTNVSYLAPVGDGLTLQGGIFSSVIGYDSLYAKDNFSYIRPWAADYTPYLMLGLNASYPFTKAVTGTFGLVNGYFHLAHANDVPSVLAQMAVRLDDRLRFKQTVLYGPHQSNPSPQFWRVLSDTIVERTNKNVTVAFEYQLGAEQVDAPGRPLALWIAGQLPVHWTVRSPWSITLRPEVAWDRDGRWIGAPQSVGALTTTVEYRVPSRRTHTTVRVEYRIDASHGTGGGFFTDRQGMLTPTQNVLAIAAIVSFETSARE
jgi:hypothetical protein